MGVATGCGCKEVYRFSHTTYPYFSCICSFCSSIIYCIHGQQWPVSLSKGRKLSFCADDMVLYKSITSIPDIVNL